MLLFFPPEKLFIGLPLIYKGTIFLSFCMECSMCRMSVYCFFKGTFIQVYGRPYHIFFSEMQHVFAVFAKLHVTCLKFFLWNVYVCALINKPFLENWKMQIYLKKVFFSPLIEIKVFYSINLLLVSKCDTVILLCVRIMLVFFLNLEYMYMYIWKENTFMHRY